SPIHRECAEQIRRVGEEAQVRIFANTIPTSVSVKNASRDQKSLLEFCISLPVSQAYIALGGELMTILEEESMARAAFPDTEMREPELPDLMEQSINLPTPESTLGPPTESSGYFYSALRLFNRNFVLLWLAQSVSQLGSQVYVIAVVFWIKRATDSASLIASMLMVSGILNIILSGVGGTFADRHSRRKIIIYCDLVRGILVLSLAGLLYLVPHATKIIIFWLMGVTLCMSVSVAFFTPAISAAIPDLVPRDEVRRANSLRQLTAQLALFVGQGLGGTLFRLWGAPLLVLINGLSFLFAALSESFIKIPQAIPEKGGTGKTQRKSFKEDIKEGLHYVWNNMGLRRLFFFSAIFNFFTMPIVVLMPFYVEDFLKVQMDWYGYLLAIFGVGILAGSLSAGFIKLKGKVRGRVMITFAIFNSIIIGSLGFVTSLKEAVILAFVIGAMGAFNGVNISTILQMSTPTEIRGRAFGLLHTLSGSIAPVGMGLGGIIYDLVGRDITLIYGGCGAMMVLLSILVSMSRVFREFIAYEQPTASRQTTN
ncbi:MAG: MFS transporter, partial [Acidobacteria bacterium]|nr:MFS transporter [Acidobacteriota bacterium]